MPAAAPAAKRSRPAAQRKAEPGVRRAAAGGDSANGGMPAYLAGQMGGGAVQRACSSCGGGKSPAAPVQRAPDEPKPAAPVQRACGQPPGVRRACASCAEAAEQKSAEDRGDAHAPDRPAVLRAADDRPPATQRAGAGSARGPPAGAGTSTSDPTPGLRRACGERTPAVARKERMFAGEESPVQRACAACADEGVARRARTDRDSGHDGDLAAVGALTRRSGEALDPVLRSRLEARMGTTLPDVRLHTDGEAAGLAERLDARAFATGNHVAFAQGAYDPHSPAGLHLLVHELAHTVQQARGEGPAAGSVSQPGDPHEVAADAVADAVVLGAPAPSVTPAAPAPAGSGLAAAHPAGADAGGGSAPAGAAADGAAAAGDAAPAVSRGALDWIEENVVDPVASTAEDAYDTASDLAEDAYDTAADVAEDVGEAIEDGVDAAGEAISSGIDAAGDLIDAISQEVIDAANALADAIGGIISIGIDGITIDIPPFQFCPTIPIDGIELPGFEVEFPFLAGVLPLDGMPMALYGYLGAYARATPKLSAQLGPCFLKQARLHIDPLGLAMSVDTAFSIAGALGVGAELGLGVEGECGLLVWVPDTPIVLELPVVGVQVEALGAGLLVGAINYDAEQHFSVSGLSASMSGSHDIDAGISASLGVGLAGQISVLGQNLCRLVWPLWSWSGQSAAHVGLSWGLDVGTGGISIDPALTGAEFDTIPFEQLPLAFNTDALASDCPLCGMLDSVGLWPKLRGGAWDPARSPGNVLPGPRHVYEKTPSFTPSSCRGACGPDCDTCDPKQGRDLVVCEPLENGGHNLWLYKNHRVCPTHAGCREHDACYDWCGDDLGLGIIGPCHRWCDLQCVCGYALKPCTMWIFGKGTTDGSMEFADSAEIIGSCECPCPTPTGDSATAPWRGCLGEPVELFPRTEMAAIHRSGRSKRIPFYRKSFVIAKPPLGMVTLKTFLRGAYEADFNAGVGPATLTDVCLLFDPNPSGRTYTGTATLRLEADLRAALRLTGILDGVLELNCVDLARLQASLTGTAQATLRPSLSATVAISCRGGELFMDVGAAFKLCLDLMVRLTARIRAWVLSYQVYDGQFEIARKQWEKCWETSIGVTPGQMPWPAGGSAPASGGGAAAPAFTPAQTPGSQAPAAGPAGGGAGAGAGGSGGGATPALAGSPAPTSSAGTIDADKLFEWVSRIKNLVKEVEGSPGAGADLISWIGKVCDLFEDDDDDEGDDEPIDVADCRDQAAGEATVITFTGSDRGEFVSAEPLTEIESGFPASTPPSGNAARVALMPGWQCVLNAGESRFWVFAHVLHGPSGSNGSRHLNGPGRLAWNILIADKSANTSMFAVERDAIRLVRDEKKAAWYDDSTTQAGDSGDHRFFADSFSVVFGCLDAQNRRRRVRGFNDSGTFTVQRPIPANCTSSGPPSAPAGGGTPPVSPMPLNGADGSPAEVAAERAADALVAGHGPVPVGGAGAGMRVTPEQQARIAALRGGGSALPARLVATWSPRLGLSLARVRVHDDARAARLCAELRAQAFTVGSDIFLGAGAPSFDGPAGLHLLAHELAHVAQGGDGVQLRLDPAPSPMPAATSRGGRALAALAQLEITGAKRRHLPLYQRLAQQGDLMRLRGYDREEPEQIDVWRREVVVDEARLRARLAEHPAGGRGGGRRGAAPAAPRDPVPANDRDAMHLLVGTRHLRGTKREVMRMLQIPTWDRQGRQVPGSGFQVDHIVELQISGQHGEGVGNSLENMELLDQPANGRSGSQIRRRIYAKVADYLATLASPPSRRSWLAQTDIIFERVVVVEPGDEGASRWWTRQEIADALPAGRATVPEDTPLEGTPDRFVLASGPDGVSLARLPTSARARRIVPTGTQATALAGLTITSLDLGTNRGSAARGDEVGTLNATWNLPRDWSTDAPTVAVPLLSVGPYAASPGPLPPLPAHYAHLSPVQFDRVAVGDNGVEADGRLDPSLALIAGHPIDVTLRGDELAFSTTIGASGITVPIPGVTIDAATLSLFYSTRRGFGVGGGVEFSLGSFATGSLEASFSTRGGVAFTGTLDFDTALFDRATITVAYREGRWSFTGTVAITTPGRIPGVASAELTVSSDADGWSLLGSVEPQIPGIRSAELGIRRGDDGWEFSGDLAFADHPLIANGRLHAVLAQRGGRWTVAADGSADLRIPGIPTSVRVSYDDGTFTAEATVRFARGMLSGEATFGVTNAAPGGGEGGEGDAGTGAPPGPADPAAPLTLYGGGRGTLALAPWLALDIGFRLLPNGEIEVTGGFHLPAALDLVEARRFERELFAMRIDIPIVGVSVAGQRVGIFATIGGALSAEAVLGPVQLTDLALEITYNPSHEDQTRITGSAEVVAPAEAGLTLAVDGGVGVGIPLVSATAGLRVTGRLGLSGAARAAVEVDWSPGQGLAIDSVAEVLVQPRLRFDVTGFVLVELDLWLTEIELFREDWDLASFEFGSAMTFGVRFPLRYREGQPFTLSLDDVEFIAPEIDVPELLGGLVDQITGEAEEVDTEE
jgi:hypothetical protein